MVLLDQRNMDILRRRMLLKRVPGWENPHFTADFVDRELGPPSISSRSSDITDSYSVIDPAEFEETWPWTAETANAAADHYMEVPEESTYDIGKFMSEAGTSSAVAANLISSGVTAWQTKNFDSTLGSEYSQVQSEVSQHYSDMLAGAKWSFQNTDAQRYKAAGETYLQNQQTKISDAKTDYNNVQSTMDIFRTAGYATASAFGGLPVLGVAAVDAFSRLFTPSAPTLDDPSTISYDPVKTYGVWADPDIDDD